MSEAGTGNRQHGLDGIFFRLMADGRWQMAKTPWAIGYLLSAIRGGEA